MAGSFRLSWDGYSSPQLTKAWRSLYSFAIWERMVARDGIGLRPFLGLLASQ